MTKNGKRETQTITEKDGWKYSFASFSGYENRKAVPYGITVEPVPEYSIAKDGMNFTASYTPGTKTISGTVR